MFRVKLGLATAMFLTLAASPAFAGCCGSNLGWGGGWNSGWGVNSWGGGCCNSGYTYAQPAPIVVQAPVQQVIMAAPPPVFVQAPPQQIFVQQSQPEVIFQQASAPVPTYTVNQGPHYAGPEFIGYPRTRYNIDTAIRPFPYVSGGYYNPNRFHGRPLYRGWRGAGYRGWRGTGYRGWRGHGVYRGGYSRRSVTVHAGRHHRGVTVRRSWN